MRKIDKNSGGFGTIELVLLLVIVIVISSVGWYMWHTKNQSEHNLKVASSSSTEQQTTNSSQLNSQKPVNTVTATPQPTQTNPTTTQPQPVAGTGIKGETLMGAATGCYSADPNSSCGKPPHVQASIDVQGRSSTPGASARSITTVTSDANGLFSVDLLPGTYFLVPKPLANGEQASSQTITVTPGQYSTVTFTYN